MKFKAFKPIPVIIGTAAILLAVFLHSNFFKRHFDFLERQEWTTYDKRVKFARRFDAPIATNLAFVAVDEVTMKVLSGPPHFANWPYPRMLHGQLVRELAAQGTKAIGFDVIFGELNPHAVLLPDQTTRESDDFFAEQMAKAGMVILAAEAAPLSDDLSEEERDARELQRVYPPPLFATNAMAVGDISAEADADGVLRRARAYVDDSEQGRRWHMGILLAAKELGLDLANASHTTRGLRLVSTNGEVFRLLPVDENGFFYINWSISAHDPRLLRVPYGLPILLDDVRPTGSMDDYRTVLETFLEISDSTNMIGDQPLAGKLVMVGSKLVGNNVSDVGATPLHKKDFLVSKHWNVANSVITGQFVARSPYWLELLIIVFLGLTAGIVTLRLRAITASLVVLGLIVAYVIVCFALFVQLNYWLPIVIPVVGAMIMTHICMVTYRVRVEQNERRRVKSVFAKMVSPNVVNELLSAEKLSLGGSRRQITVYFADVRGFTEMTDQRQSQAEEYVRKQGLTGDAAENYFDEQARETLATVNLYLGTIADKIKEHKGTLDKYIGDCVMAFWGAPTDNERHALQCVCAAIDSQRAMQALNERRAEENKQREQENIARSAAGEPPLQMHPLLTLGSGINTGTIIAGLMGSDVHGLNYTVFGREVNLASRLEGVSGRGRIIIGEATYRDILRDDPALAATCVELPPEKVKGFRDLVRIFEVPWRITPTVCGDTVTSPASAPGITHA